MRLNSKDLMGLPVHTRSGTALGKVSSLDVDCDTGRIATMHVKTRGLVPGLMDHELMVTWDQIIEITEKEVIVQDNTVPAGASALATATGTAVPGTEGVAPLAMQSDEGDA